MTKDRILKTAGWNLVNNYTKLPQQLYALQNPTPVKDPKIIIFNTYLAKELGLSTELLDNKTGAYIFSGNTLPLDSVPVAQGYAGHQFGHFTILGDGRAILIGEQISPNNENFDIQLKGSGRTPYSRGGDGRATLSSMLREYIISEAINSLGIPTTRSLAVVSTGNKVQRETDHDGAILTRISKGHIRVGSFQFAATKGSDTLKALADYTIDKFYPSLIDEPNTYLALLVKVIQVQADLVAKWQSIGFIHGVLNTDNVSVAGETIDYGPCAFMDTYHPDTVFSSIDRDGRYSYGNQPQITHWNLARFAETLLPLLDKDQDKALKLAEEAIGKFVDHYESNWLKIMSAKIGISVPKNDDRKLILDLLNIMEQHKLDFTNTFLDIMNPEFKSNYQNFNAWLQQWRQRLINTGNPWSTSLKIMEDVNPRIIPRNHQVERVLKAAVDSNDLAPLNQLISVLLKPYNHSESQGDYALPPKSIDPTYKTYCGT